MTSSKRDPDPDRLLLERVDARKVPRWEDSEDGSCQHCHDKFKLGKRHHCRLCGFEFCSLCSSKYHLPSRFKQKSKAGPDRVCFGCRDEVLASHRMYDRTIELPRPRLISRIRDGRLYIYPPEWVEEEEYANCKQCLVPRGRHAYYCRICGEMFCSDCTFKDMVPDAFRQKLYKQGPVRICFECRWKITGGAILVDERDALLPPEQEVFRAAMPSPKLIQSRTVSNKQLFNAVLHGSREELEQVLMSPTVDVNSFDEGLNMTPLMHCARKGMLDKMRMLLSSCSESLIIDHRNKQGMSALMYAAKEGEREVLSTLVALPRCNVNLSSLTGNTALMIAAEAGHAKAVVTLLAAGDIDYNYCNKTGRTALMLAAGNGHAKVIEELLKVKRLDVEAKNVAGKTALWFAEQKQHENCRAILNKAIVHRRQRIFKKLLRIHLNTSEDEAQALSIKFVQAGVKTDLENLTIELIQAFEVSADVEEKLRQLMLASFNRRSTRVSRTISALDLELSNSTSRSSVVSLQRQNSLSKSIDALSLQGNSSRVSSRKKGSVLQRAITMDVPFGGAQSQTRFISSSISQDFSSNLSRKRSIFGGLMPNQVMTDPGHVDESESRDSEYEHFLREITKDGFICTEDYRKLLHKYARVDTATHSNALAALRLRPRVFDQMIVKGRDPEISCEAEEDDDGQALKIMAEGGIIDRASPSSSAPQIHNCTREVIAFRVRSNNPGGEDKDEEKSSISFKEGELIGPLSRRSINSSEESVRVSLSVFVGCSVYYLTNVELKPGDVYRIGQNDVGLRNLFSEGKGSALLFRQARTLLGLHGRRDTQELQHMEVLRHAL